MNLDTILAKEFQQVELEEKEILFEMKSKKFILMGNGFITFSFEDLELAHNEKVLEKVNKAQHLSTVNGRSPLEYGFKIANNEKKLFVRVTEFEAPSDTKMIVQYDQERDEIIDQWATAEHPKKGTFTPDEHPGYVSGIKTFWHHFKYTGFILAILNPHDRVLIMSLDDDMIDEDLYQIAKYFPELQIKVEDGRMSSIIPLVTGCTSGIIRISKKVQSDTWSWTQTHKLSK